MIIISLINTYTNEYVNSVKNPQKNSKKKYLLINMRFVSLINWSKIIFVYYYYSYCIGTLEIITMDD